MYVCVCATLLNSFIPRVFGGAFKVCYIWYLTVLLLPSLSFLFLA